MLRFLPGVLLLACGGPGTPPASPGATVEVGPNWVQDVAEDPDSFGRLTATHRDQWIALHRGDYKAVLADSQGSDALQFRAQSGLAALYYRMARIVRFSWQQTEETWAKTENSGLPDGLHSIPASAKWSGWSEALSTRPDTAETSALLRALEGDADHLTALAQRPLDQAPGSRIELYNPLVYQALFESYRVQIKAPGTADLGHVIFSSCATGPTEWKAGPSSPHPLACFDKGLLTGQPALDPGLGDSDDAQIAREFVRGLDTQLANWEKSLLDKGTEAGKALVTDLNLVGIYRCQNLIALAEESLDRDRPRQALALAQMAQDMTHPREIGPLNPPLLFLLLAEANVLTGHTREALDSLEVLSDAYPEILALDETVGDLAVLKGLNRQGDSKEL